MSRPSLTQRVASAAVALFIVTSALSGFLAIGSTPVAAAPDFQESFEAGTYSDGVWSATTDRSIDGDYSLYGDSSGGFGLDATVIDFGTTAAQNVTFWHQWDAANGNGGFGVEIEDSNGNDALRFASLDNDWYVRGDAVSSSIVMSKTADDWYKTRVS